MTNAAIIRNLRIKLATRFSVWVIVLVMLELEAIALVMTTVVAPRHTALGYRELWTSVLDLGSSLPTICASLVVVLIVTGELASRMLRQQLIDGQSRDEIIIEKLLLVGLVGAIFTTIYFLVALAVAWIAATGAPGVPPVTAPEVLALLAVFLGAVGLGSMALWWALMIKQPGAAAAGWIIYAVVVERTLASSLTRVGGGAGTVANWLPVTSFVRLGNPLYYSAMPERGGMTSLSHSGAPVGHPIVIAAVWTAVFAGLAARSLKVRDM